MGGWMVAVSPPIFVPHSVPHGAQVSRVPQPFAPEIIDASPHASRRAGDGTLGIYTVNADGSNLAQLTHAIVDADPSWSPDGSGIAYSSITDGDTEIVIMNADGSRQTRITHSPGQDSGPAWKP
jgi:dipeptidyl aminopeptidase/acylaminoacyl peptidase